VIPPRFALFACFVTALFLAPPVLADARSETQQFVAGNGAATVYTSATAGTPFDVGGNRFYLDGTETSVTITVSEPSSNSVSFYNGAGTVLRSQAFCTSGTFTLTGAEFRFVVFVGSDVSHLALGGSISCGVPVAPAAGSITADYV
jgi:hypothetical protein